MQNNPKNKWTASQAIYLFIYLFWDGKESTDYDTSLCPSHTSLARVREGDFSPGFLAQCIFWLHFKGLRRWKYPAFSFFFFSCIFLRVNFPLSNPFGNETSLPLSACVLDHLKLSSSIWDQSTLSCWEHSYTPNSMCCLNKIPFSPTTCHPI